jgi:hypothetical protein
MLDAGPRSRIEYEAALQTLVGRGVHAVTYFEIAYEDGEPAWSQESPHFDSLDFGMTWTLDDGAVFSFTWGSEFTQYNVSIRREALGLPGTVRKWDASERWELWLGRPIRSASAVWEATEVREDNAHYPQHVKIEFEGAAPITVSAYEASGGHGMGKTDHITVFFREQDVPSL